MKIVLRTVVVTLVATTLVGGYCIPTYDHSATSTGEFPREAPAMKPLPEPSTEEKETEAPPATRQPVRLRVPRLGVDAPVYPHGPERGDILEPQPHKIAWWTGKGWSHPGKPGGALLAAHITDVFARLAELGEGDEIFVSFKSGATLQFRVTKRTNVSQFSVPWDTLRTVEAPTIHLVTCDLSQIGKDGRSVANDIVSAELVGPSR